MNDRNNPLLGDPAVIAERQAMNAWGIGCCCERAALRRVIWRSIALAVIAVASWPVVIIGGIGQGLADAAERWLAGLAAAAKWVKKDG